MTDQFSIEALNSKLTKGSLKPVSLPSCSYELVHYIGLNENGFICIAKILSTGFLGVKFYEPCKMNNGQCPINPYKEFSQPDL